MSQRHKANMMCIGRLWRRSTAVLQPGRSHSTEQRSRSQEARRAWNRNANTLTVRPAVKLTTTVATSSSRMTGRLLSRAPSSPKIMSQKVCRRPNTWRAQRARAPGLLTARTRSRPTYLCPLPSLPSTLRHTAPALCTARGSTFCSGGHAQGDRKAQPGMSQAASCCVLELMYVHTAL
jgi:hypothetical protein